MAYGQPKQANQATQAYSPTPLPGAPQGGGYGSGLSIGGVGPREQQASATLEGMLPGLLQQMANKPITGADTGIGELEVERAKRRERAAKGEMIGKLAFPMMSMLSGPLGQVLGYNWAPVQQKWDQNVWEPIKNLF